MRRSLRGRSRSVSLFGYGYEEVIVAARAHTGTRPDYGIRVQTILATVASFARRAASSARTSSQNPPRRPAPSAHFLERLARDHEALHVARAFADLEELRVAVEALDGVIERVPLAPRIWIASFAARTAASEE